MPHARQVAPDWACCVLLSLPRACSMFIPTLLSQGTPEQQSKWLPMSNRLQVGL